LFDSKYIVTGPQRTLQEDAADIRKLSAEIAAHAMEIGKDGVALEATQRDAAWRKSQEEAGRKRDRDRAAAMAARVADRNAQIQSLPTTLIDQQVEAKQVLDAALAKIEHDRLNAPTDYAQGEATLILRKEQAAKREDIRLHEERIRHADGNPGRY
jgi:hypothetical protein